MSNETKLKEELLPVVDIYCFERKQRQLLDELAMKRAQVEMQKQELDAANLKIHELNRHLQLLKTSSEERDSNFNLALKNVRFLENELNAKRALLGQNSNHSNILASDKENFQCLLQAEMMKNYDLTRELNELKAQHHCDVVYQQELVNQDAQTNEKINQLTKNIDQLQFTLDEMDKMKDKTQSVEELQNYIAFYRDQLEKSNVKYSKLEDNFILTHAALEKLESLMESYSTTLDSNEDVKKIVNKWQQTFNSYNEERKVNEEIINNLTQSLEYQKETNLKLCKQEDELQNKIVFLQNENQELKKQTQAESHTLK